MTTGAARTERLQRLGRLPRSIPIPRWLRVVLAAESSFWAALIVGVPPLAAGLTLILEPVDPDYWWHLTTGRWILAHQRVPFTDPFSWTHAGQAWTAHEWLAELLLALAGRAGGYAGALLLTGLISVAGYWLLLRAARYYGLSRRAICLWMLLLGGIPLWSLAVRPQVWGWALLCMLLSELAAYETGHRRSLWALPLLFAVWININLTALIGIGILGLFALGRVVGRASPLSLFPLSWRGIRKTGPDRSLFAVCLACAAALLINPRGWELLRFSLTYANPNALRYHFIGEWQRPDIHDLTLLPFWLAAPAVLFALWALLRRRALWPALAILLFFGESLKAQRYTPIYGLLLIPFAGWWVWQKKQRQRATGPVAVSGAMPVQPPSEAQPVLSASSPQHSGSPGAERERSNTRLWPGAALTAGMLLLAGIVLGAFVQLGWSEFRRTPDPRGYPAAAATILLDQYPQARLFNTYTWGGYLIYRLYPAMKVYVDGREEMYGDRFLRQFLDLAAGGAEWRTVFRQEKITAVLAERNAGIALDLSRDSDWRVAYQGSASVLYVRVR